VNARRPIAHQFAQARPLARLTAGDHERRATKQRDRSPGDLADPQQRGVFA
jgi:hypothetical protein